MVTGYVAPGGEEAFIDHKLREPAQIWDIVPGTNQESMASTSKFANAGYIIVFDKEEVNVYNASNTRITSTGCATLKGWRDEECRQWLIPLVENVESKIMETILVKAPPSELLSNLPAMKEVVVNVYELKTMPEVTRYCHAAAGFPTKSIWLEGPKQAILCHGLI